jgi:hypothetical protein
MQFQRGLLAFIAFLNNGIKTWKWNTVVEKRTLFSPAACRVTFCHHHQLLASDNMKTSQTKQPAHDMRA